VRFLLINYEYPPIGAGAANATRRISQCLVDQGHSVGVLTARFGALRDWPRRKASPSIVALRAARRPSARTSSR
jgi:hypothetical protein